MSKVSLLLISVMSGALFFGTAIAADVKEMSDMKGMNMSKPSAKEAQGVGVIKSIDAKANTVTIAHEPITALKWPAMTTASNFAHPALLEKAKVGARVRFKLSAGTGTPIISEIAATP